LRRKYSLRTALKWKRCREKQVPTCLALNPRRRALSGRVGRVIRTMPGSCLYSQHLTRRRKRSTSDCFFRHNSSTYLYAPTTQTKKRKHHQKGKPNNPKKRRTFHKKLIERKLVNKQGGKQETHPSQQLQTAESRQKQSSRTAKERLKRRGACSLQSHQTLTLIQKAFTSVRLHGWMKETSSM